MKKTNIMDKLDDGIKIFLKGFSIEEIKELKKKHKLRKNGSGRRQKYDYATPEEKKDFYKKYHKQYGKTRHTKKKLKTIIKK